ncbi:probable galacturonosyltransferase 9 [Phragmites australis]|uniref:probable galacturonosyltransferase 9 n=1 Tax=Phragmites australis TaxID=29695 RepID=UPI002D7765CF|nr:probable galacturonosyltransferase 9 [Phragmites australis]
MAGGRASARRRAVFAAVITLIFLASVSFLLSATATSSAASNSLASRLAVVQRHAEDHTAVLAAYAAHARRLSAASASQTDSFISTSARLSSLASRLSLSTVGLLEKETRGQVKRARALAAGAKEAFDTQSKIHKLSDTVFAVGQHLLRARRAGVLNSRIAAGSTPKSLHCLAMRLLETRLTNASAIPEDSPVPPPQFTDPSLYHYAIFSDNVLAVSVVVASAARAAAEPSRHIFHVVTAPMYLPAFRVWFARCPPPLGAHVQLLAFSDFPFLNASSSPVLKQIEAGNRDVALLDYLRFYLPEMFPALPRVVLLEDDVVVQRDLAGLWRVDMGGNVNTALHTCFGGFRRYGKYLNFSDPIVQERFSPRACAWSYGINVFDLQAWRREQCTEQFHRFMEMNENGTLWDPTSVLPAGLMTFYGKTKPLDKSWHVMGLGYNPHIRPEDIRGAAVIHFNGNMKPWLDVAFNQYKHLWTKYVDTEMEFLTLCNFGL